MSAHPLYTQAARDDLREIADHISQYSPARARSFVEALREHCRRLAASPRAHRPREEFGLGVRSTTHGAYLILYTHRDAKQVVIERVVHGARHLDRLRDEQDEEDQG